MANSKQYFPSVVSKMATCKISDISEHGNNYFAKVSYLTGKEQWQHVSLLVGSSLQKLAKRVVDGEQDLSEIGACSVEIHNLHFSADANNANPEKPYLNNQGVLIGISKAVF